MFQSITFLHYFSGQDISSAVINPAIL